MKYAVGIVRAGIFSAHETARAVVLDFTTECGQRKHYGEIISLHYCTVNSMVPAAVKWDYMTD